MRVRVCARAAYFVVVLLALTGRIFAASGTAPSGACVYALDATSSRALQLAGAQSIYSSCGIVSESSASDGFEMEGAETLYLQNQAQVSVVGGAQLNGQTYLWDVVNNKQTQAVQVVSPGDPLASLVAPSSGSIVSKSHAYYDMNAKPTNNTLQPGVYCGGLTIGNTNGTTFTMSPGLYIMAGGGFTLNSQAAVSGSGVTIYNTSSSGWGCSSASSYTPVTISGQVTATLSAPTSGNYNGILFFGDRSGCSTAGNCTDQINGGSTVSLSGAIYFASDQLLFTGSTTSTSCAAVVADKIVINGNSTFTNSGCTTNVVGITVSPATASLYAGQTQQFTATVTNASNTAVTWSVSGSGTISSTGLYSAPSSIVSTQTVTVTATSQADTTKSATATITLNPPAQTTITWPTPAAISYGTALNSTQLDAVFSVEGSCTYTPAAGTVLSVGTHTLSVTCVPSDSALYLSATATVQLTVNQISPTITWPTPSAITYGTALSSTQLDAVFSVAGSCIYSPAAGAILSSGTQALSVTCTPTDTTDYASASASVSLTVKQEPLTVTVDSFTRAFGAENPTLTGTIAGIVNGDAITATYSTTATSTSAAGSYPITATVAGSALSNYAVTIIPGTLTITGTTSQCTSSGYNYVRAITIDHTKVPNTDLTSFPFLFTTTDTALATSANGGHVLNANGYDIIFTSDAAGTQLLDYEVESYNAATGQIVAWVRIPTLSHSTDTVIYLLYGNSSVTASQQNTKSVWDSNYGGVFHISGTGTTLAADLSWSRKIGQ